MTQFAIARTASPNLRRVLLGSAGMAVLCLANAAVHAQEAPRLAAADEAPAAEITVTGSRVVRDGYNAPTPVTVVGAEVIRNVAPNNIAEVVNQLPSVIGSTTPNNSQGSISNVRVAPGARPSLFARFSYPPCSAHTTAIMDCADGIARL